ncbi:unnamed protein product [Adineta steineri]|uniref:Uncharacterized protein n=2 Tax=Adineta steineri TaxID=433720 RepID=A0A815FGL3_9BILA|nr:unnamed protein product [Adineta steineri]
MTNNLSTNDLDTSNEEIVPLCQDIGYTLIKYLNGLNVINFIEAINDSDQFYAIEIISEKAFYKKFTKLMKKEKVKVDVPYVYCYLDTWSIDDEGYVRPTEQFYQSGAPILRLFVHSTFTDDAFEHICSTYKTSSFQCYTRLIPLNIHTYVGNSTLVDFFSYKNSNGYNRELNVYKRNLFKGVIII